MNLSDLTAKGGFVALAPVQKEIAWVKKVEGVEETLTFNVFVKRRTFGSIERVFSGAEDRSKAALFIAESIRLGDDASEALTYEQAYNLDPDLASLFLKAINEVNGSGSNEPKN